jgi:hypothetical protein
MYMRRFLSTQLPSISMFSPVAPASFNCFFAMCPMPLTRTFSRLLSVFGGPSEAAHSIALGIVVVFRVFAFACNAVWEHAIRPASVSCEEFGSGGEKSATSNAAFELDHRITLAIVTI